VYKTLAERGLGRSQYIIIKIYSEHLGNLKRISLYILFSYYFLLFYWITFTQQSWI